MNKTTIIIAVAIVAAAGYYYYDRQKNAGALNSSTNPDTGGGAGGGGTPAPTPIATQPIYKRGSTGAAVQIIQRAINTVRLRAARGGANPPAAIAEDGNFGAQTEAALLFLFGYREIRPTDYIETHFQVLGYPENWLATYARY